MIHIKRILYGLVGLCAIAILPALVVLGLYYTPLFYVLVLLIIVALMYSVGYELERYIDD